MSTVVAVTEKWSLAESTLSTSGRTAVKGYEVLFDTAGDDLNFLARTADGVVQPGQKHPADVNLVATSSTARAISPILYEVLVQFGTLKVAGFSTEITADGDDPLDLSPTVDWDFMETEEEVDHDAAGAAIVNANGELIHVIKKFNTPVLTVVRNFYRYNLPTIVEYMAQGGATNSDTFLGVLPGQALVMRIKPTRINYGSDYFERVEFKVAFREPLADASLTAEERAARAWYLRHADRGFWVKVAGTKYRAKVNPSDDGTDAGDPAPEPVLLQSDGTRQTDPASTHWIYTRQYPSLPFETLDIFA